MLQRAFMIAVLVAVAAAPALAQEPAAGPPSNDSRVHPAALRAGVDVRGTTVGATREASEPPNCPRDGGGSVWYAYTAPRDGLARLALTTSGGLDASVAVYRAEGSTLSRVACADTVRGRLFTSVDLDAGPFLVRVAERKDSKPGGFRLQFSGVLVEPDPPGRSLGRDGTASGTLDGLLRPFAQWSRRLRAGHDYRVRVALEGDRCRGSVTLVRPDGARRFLGCRDYTVVTPGPGESGRWTVALRADEPGTSRYRVSIVGVGADDLAPGPLLRAFGVARGTVSGRGPDAQDVFRLDVTRRAEVTLRLRSAGAMTLRLRTEAGRAVTSAEVDDDTGEIRTRLRPGRFVVVVDAAESRGGRYTLSRLTRTITASRVSFDGAESRTRAPGGSSAVQVAVTPAASGRARVTLERFDPQFGWRFWSRRTIPVTGGRGAFRIATLQAGRIRARAEFLGTRTAGPSRARRAAVLHLRPPLQD